MENSETKLIDLVNRLTLEKKEIVCYPEETFLNLKRKLRDEINVDERRIRFYDEKSSILNNNDIVHDLQIIQYDLDSSVNQQITPVIIEIRNNHFKTPKWVQVNSNDTVKHLKNEISKNDSQDLKTFLFDTNGVMLDDNKTIESYNLINGSKVKVWKGPNLLVTMKFYTNFKHVGINSDYLTLQFSMTDSIRDIKKRISEIVSPGIAVNLALITDSSYWQDNKLLIDYPIKHEETEVFVANLQRNPGISFMDQIKSGKYAKIFDATDGFGNRIRVNRYKLEKRIVNEKKILKYAIISHTLLNRINIDKFVELITMFEEGKYFYIATECIERGSLKKIYEKGISFSNRDIIHYSIQICQALDYMHSNKFMHRNLNCSSVLVDDGNNIKLTNFHLSKYLFNATSEQLLEGIPGSRIETSKCWLAPEVLRNDPYGLKSDIWSLAVTVLEMFTHNRPYPEMNVLRATHRIVTENTIHYDRNLIPEYFHNFLHQCFRVPQWERPSAKQCIQLLEAFPSVNN